jgi:hypothetical protein
MSSGLPVPANQVYSVVNDLCDAIEASPETLKASVLVKYLASCSREELALIPRIVVKVSVEIDLGDYLSVYDSFSAARDNVNVAIDQANRERLLDWLRINSPPRQQREPFMNDVTPSSGGGPSSGLSSGPSSGGPSSDPSSGPSLARAEGLSVDEDRVSLGPRGLNFGREELPQTQMVTVMAPIEHEEIPTRETEVIDGEEDLEGPSNTEEELVTLLNDMLACAKERLKVESIRGGHIDVAIENEWMGKSLLELQIACGVDAAPKTKEDCLTLLGYQKRLELMSIPEGKKKGCFSQIELRDLYGTFCSPNTTGLLVETLKQGLAKEWAKLKGVLILNCRVPTNVLPFEEEICSWAASPNQYSMLDFRDEDTNLMQWMKYGLLKRVVCLFCL